MAQTVTHNLEESLTLYLMLEPYLPKEEVEPKDLLNVIIENIKNGKRHEDYIDMIVLMSKVERDVLLKSDAIEALEAFTAGLVEFDIVNLVHFFKRIGYHGNR